MEYVTDPYFVYQIQKIGRTDENENDIINVCLNVGLVTSKYVHMYMNTEIVTVKSHASKRNFETQWLVHGYKGTVTVTVTQNCHSSVNFTFFFCIFRQQTLDRKSLFFGALYHVTYYLYSEYNESQPVANEGNFVLFISDIISVLPRSLLGKLKLPLILYSSL